MTYAHRLSARHLIYTTIELIREMEDDPTFEAVICDTFGDEAYKTLDNLAKAKAELAEAHERFSQVQIPSG